MILVCGATGLLGSRVVARLRELDLSVRALVRPTTDPTALEDLGVEVTRGDLRDPASLTRAVDGASAVVSTANTISRVLGGERHLTIREVDERGHADLVAAAEAAGVQRFVFLSFLQSILDSDSVFSRAKLATEARLRRSPMSTVVVRPGMFQEVWLTELVGFDWKGGKVTIFGKGRIPQRYVAVDDVASAVVHSVTAADPPAVLELDGPEALSRVEAADAFERALGRPLARRHVPRAALRAGAVGLRRLRPVMSSVMAQSLAVDLHPSAVDDSALRALGIEARPAGRFIEEAVAAHGRDPH